MNGFFAALILLSIFALFGVVWVVEQVDTWWTARQVRRRTPTTLPLRALLPPEDQERRRLHALSEIHRASLGSKLN